MSGGMKRIGKGSTVRDRVGDRHRVRVRAVLRVALRTGRRWVRRGLHAKGFGDGFAVL